MPQDAFHVPESIDADAQKMPLELLEERVRQQEVDLSKAKVALREWSDQLVPFRPNDTDRYSRGGGIRLGYGPHGAAPAEGREGEHLGA